MAAGYYTEALEAITSGNEALQNHNYASAEDTFRQAIESLSDSNPITYGNIIGQARHGLAKSLLKQAKDAQDASEAGAQCEAVLAMRITGEADRRLILDTASTLILAYWADGSLWKAKKLCRLVIDASRKFPERREIMHDSIALMAELCTADKDTKNAKIYQGLLPKGFQPTPTGIVSFPDSKTQSTSQSAPPSPHPVTNTAFPAPSKGPRATATQLPSSRSATPGPSSSIPPKIDYYDPYMVKAYDPSLTRALLKSMNLFPRMTMDGAVADIAPGADLRNPSHPLSPHFTPFVTVPVPISAFNNTDIPNTANPPAYTADNMPLSESPLTPTTSVTTTTSTSTTNNRTKFFGRAKSAASAVRKLGYPGQEERYRFVRMSRDEYTKYWARDSNGNYLGTEPEDIGKTRIKMNWTEGGGKSISQLEYQGSVTEGKDPFKVLQEKGR